jgi:acyl-CoA synthetase (AMP-forming)/AMP-acid ligase II
VLMAIPAMAELLFLRGSVDQRAFPSLRKVALGGSGVSNQLVRRCGDELGAQVYVGYGLTECPGFCVISAPSSEVAELGTMVGAATEGYELAILGEDGASVPLGELGEVCLRSHFMMLGYLGNPEATAEAVDENGWLHTGDLGSLDGAGQLSIRGRKKEMYIRGGFNVYPREVEEAFMENSAVSLAAVHSVPDAVLGERGHAWIVPTASTSPTEDQLREAVAQRLAYYKLPDVIHVVDSLPMNAIGKIDKVALARRVIKEQPAAAAAG